MKNIKPIIKGEIMEFTIMNIMAVAASGLMLIVTGGIIYLTASEWRDRRRQQRDKTGR
ncbi:MAG: hypothetical protein VKJ25_09940 [Okeania sp.]|nr:hypothetical protein [Okeania sp.]